MTLEKLNAHAELRRHLAEAEQLRESLYAAAEPGAQVLSGMPHAPGYRDKLGGLAVEIADISTTIETLDGQIAAQEAEIERFIQSIPNYYTRMIFRLRFLRGMTWARVAVAVGGRNTEESVKSTCYRYIGTCTDKTCTVVTPSNAP